MLHLLLQKMMDHPLDHLLEFAFGAFLLSCLELLLFFSLCELSLLLKTLKPNDTTLILSEIASNSSSNI